MTGTPSRIGDARRRAAGAKKKLTVAAAASFVAATFLAYLSHSGTSAGSASTRSTASSGQGDLATESDEFGFAPGSIAPSSGTPQVQTHVS
jgi:hypothetical protein